MANGLLDRHGMLAIASMYQHIVGIIRGEGKNGDAGIGQRPSCGQQDAGYG
jgi:hypothetical protein